MNPVVVPDVVAVGRYQCPDCGFIAWEGFVASFVCCGRRVELLAVVTVDAPFVDATSAARPAASTLSSAAKREEWRRRAVSFFAWLAVGLAIGAVFCGAWAIAEWGWAR